MFGYNNQPNKAPAPSIWSFDSGYASHFSLEDESPRIDAIAAPSNETNSTKGLQLQQDENGDLRLANFWNVHVTDQVRLKREEPSIEPVVTKLSVFTTKDITHTTSDFLLPDISSENEGCLTCEFWKIANPGEDVRCEDCRIPQIIEPSALFSHEAKEKEPVFSPCPTKTAKGKEPMMPTCVTRCSACELSALIDPSRASTCPSCFPESQYLFPVSPTSLDSKVRRSRAGRNSKLPLSALNRLQEWLNANQDNPYPSAEVKRQLAQECGIREKQVTTWFTNARARQLNPMETYLSSGSEDEGAHESDIASAAETPSYTARFSFISDSRHAYRRAGSVSGSSAFSQPGPNRPAPSRRGKKKNYRRANQPPQITEHADQSGTSLNDNQNISQDTWQCTFCYRHLVPKSWRRHEETQHRPKAQWTCMLFGPRLSFQHRAGSCCAFCMAKDPPEDHFLKHHRISECAIRPSGDRTFFRPDHLRQHVKNFHQATLFDIAQCRWKRAAESNIDGWTCGFCGDRLETWDKRETHIANHFKEGMTMDSWKDFPEPEVVPVKNQEKESRGLSRLSRTFSRRSRSSQIPTSSPYDFSSNLAPLPTNVGTSAAPLLPDINTDPLMDPTYGSYDFMDWSQIVDTQIPVTEPNFQSPFMSSDDFEALNNVSLNSVLNNYGNDIDYQGTWNPQQ